MPVDIGGMLVYGLIYVVGLLALVVAVLINGNKTIALIFIAYIGMPIVAFLSAKAEQSVWIHKRENGDAMDLKAFERYCKGRQQVVHSKAHQEDGVSLVVRIEKGFTGSPTDFNAHPLFNYLSTRRELCAQTGVTALEGIYDGYYSKEGNTRDREVRRYSLCTNEEWIVIPEVQSRYELVLGRTGNRDRAPWKEGGRWMSSSSVQVVDRLTGQTLAEDTMYFLQNSTGEAGCPFGLDQLSHLLAEVFGPGGSSATVNTPAVKEAPVQSYPDEGSDAVSFKNRPAFFQRRRHLGSGITEFRFARYFEDCCAAKLDRVVSARYPAEVRGAMHGVVLVQMAIRADGTVESAEVVRSSGHEFLDQAAVVSVNAASPFLPFPPAIRRDTDVVEMVRPVRFEQ